MLKSVLKTGPQLLTLNTTKSASLRRNINIPSQIRLLSTDMTSIYSKNAMQRQDHYLCSFTCLFLILQLLTRAITAVGPYVSAPLVCCTFITERYNL